MGRASRNNPLSRENAKLPPKARPQTGAEFRDAIRLNHLGRILASQIESGFGVTGVVGSHPPGTCDLECGNRFATGHATCRHGRTPREATSNVIAVHDTAVGPPKKQKRYVVERTEE